MMWQFRGNRPMELGDLVVR